MELLRKHVVKEKVLTNIEIQEISNHDETNAE